MPAAVILQSAHDMVGNAVIGVDVVELSERQLFIKLPGSAPVMGNGQTSVIAIEDKIRVDGVDPESMMVRVDATVGNDGLKCPAAIFTHGYGLVDIVKPVFIVGVNADVLEIKGPGGYHRRVTVDQFPFLPAVV